MTYGENLFAAYYNAHRLPEWLPTDGLVYFDDFAELRDRAPTGQAYSQMAGATAAYTIETLGGRKCLYKAEADNRLDIDLQMQVKSHTWGLFAYDSLGTCTNQQVFNLRGYASGTDILRFRDSSNRISVFNYKNGTSTAAVRVTDKYSGGAWHLILGWQGSSWWGVGFDGIQNLSSVQKSPQETDNAVILTTTTYGVGIRNAFCYDRVLTQTDVEQIYTNGL